MAFRDDVRAALEAPLGRPLGRRIVAATVTAIVAAGAGARDAGALAELVVALERAGVPRKRQFVLLADASGGPEASRARARALRVSLDLPVLPHDVEGPRCTLGGPASRLEVDDELREAEEIVLCGEFAPDAKLGIRGGPAALWPMLGAPGDAAALAAALAEAPGVARARAALDRVLGRIAPAGAGFALAWSAEASPRVLAGDPAAVYAAAADAGWLAARAAAAD